MLRTIPAVGRARTSSRVRASYSRTIRSSPPTASSRPSGENRVACRWSPSSTLHTRASSDSASHSSLASAPSTSCREPRAMDRASKRRPLARAAAAPSLRASARLRSASWRWIWASWRSVSATIASHAMEAETTSRTPMIAATRIRRRDVRRRSRRSPAPRNLRIRSGTRGSRRARRRPSCRASSCQTSDSRQPRLSHSRAASPTSARKTSSSRPSSRQRRSRSHEPMRDSWTSSSSPAAGPPSCALRAITRRPSTRRSSTSSAAAGRSASSSTRGTTLRVPSTVTSRSISGLAASSCPSDNPSSTPSAWWTREPATPPISS